VADRDRNLEDGQWIAQCAQRLRKQWPYAKESGKRGPAGRRRALHPLRHQKVERHLKALTVIQDRIAELNYLFVARAKYRHSRPIPPLIWNKVHRLRTIDTSRRTEGRVMKILLAVDGSIYTKRMLAYVAAHDEWLGARHQYTLLNCAPKVGDYVESSVGNDVARKFEDEAAEIVLTPIRAFFAQQGIDASCVKAVGHAADVIAETARSGKYDLLIMGSHGQGMVAGIVLGSVAMKVLAKCSTPVLLIR
jgi:nucleotide-binding universal stress UspA family protein